MEEFTDLLERFLSAREYVRTNHGPLWEEYQSAKQRLNDLFRELMEKKEVLAQALVVLERVAKAPQSVCDGGDKYCDCVGKAVGDVLVAIRRIIT